MKHRWIANLTVSLVTLLGLFLVAYRPATEPELVNRIPEAAPYDTAEARAFPPPYEEHWKEHNPARCGTCHSRIFEEWNGSMMSNSWRDPAWRAAFLLLARKTATDGNCDVPEPPDGTERAKLNPFAEEGCASRFDFGDGEQRMTRPGSLLDGFCSRCHMPTNYADNIPLQNVSLDEASGLEHGRLNENFDPTSDAGTGIAFAKLDSQLRNTDTGKQGLFCAVCHTMATSRDTPFHNFESAAVELVPAVDEAPRQDLLAATELEVLEPPTADDPHLGFGIGAGAFRFSPHAIATGEVFGPLSHQEVGGRDDYLSEVFDQDVPFQQGKFNKHQGFRHVKFERAEMCGPCHDVTNPLTLKNELGHWAGGFPIERTYTEWLDSRYADRPGNEHFEPEFKRDCQTCHMQQDFGQPGTAQTLYRDGRPEPPLKGRVADDGPEREPYFSHHFIGGNAYIPGRIGADVTATGSVAPYPKLSVFSFSSKDPESPYYNAYWTDTEASGAVTQHARLAWDRLRNALTLDVRGPSRTAPGTRVPLEVELTNTGCGHDFPSGFPEGRIAWVALRAYDLGNGEELEIHDSHWDRTSRGVGYLTQKDVVDPSYEGCEWKLPAGTPDPYSFQMKAVASLGFDPKVQASCPTLDLVYATPLNLVTNEDGLPIDADGRVIDRDNPRGFPRYEDLDGDGEVFDDAYLIDTRLRPLPHADARALLDRYSILVPDGATGPIAVTAAVYYQSLEAIVAQKFLGNMADLDTDRVLEPCVLGGPCDGRTPTIEPAAVEGAPPVPVEVVNFVIPVDGRQDREPPRLTTYPLDGDVDVYHDVVVKVTFSEPVQGLDATTFTLEDADGRPVPAMVDQIGDGTWGLFSNEVFLEPGARYTARVAAGVCDWAGNCTRGETVWSFEVSERTEDGRGDTSVPLGFPRPAEP